MTTYCSVAARVMRVTAERTHIEVADGRLRRRFAVSRRTDETVWWESPSALTCAKGAEGELYLSAGTAASHDIAINGRRKFTPEAAASARVSEIPDAQTPPVLDDLRPGRRITIEVMRTGDPYGRELSSDQDYIVLREDDPPTTERFDLNQTQLEAHLDDFARGHSQQPPEKLAEEAWKLLGSVQDAADRDWVHIRLRITPNELAQIPFEAAASPEKLSLLLGAQPRFTLTREVRLTHRRPPDWPVVPRLLFAWAHNGSCGVPHDQHRTALLAAMAPWLSPPKTPPTVGMPPTEAHFVEVPNATLESISERCASFQPTHVHLLTHGGVRPGGRGVIGLQNSDQRDGRALASALSAGRRLPAVVSVVSCKGGHVGDVTVPGASIAHELNRIGVQFTIACQTPFTIEGSKLFARQFYPLLLQGADPRKAIAYVRSQIRSSCGTRNDWAGLVSYCHLPADFDRRLVDTRLAIVLEQMKIANRWSEEVFARGADGKPRLELELEPELDKVCHRLDAAVRRLEARRIETAPANAAQRTEMFGLLGSAYKRRAELMHRRGRSWEPDLTRARESYARSAEESLNDHWPAVQFLAIAAALGEPMTAHRTLWQVAQLAAERSFGSADGDSQIWALGSLAELCLLEPLTVEAAEFDATSRVATDRGQTYLQLLRQLAPSGSFVFESTARQLERHISWWKTDRRIEAAEALRRVLPY